jgi:protein SCO1
MAAVWLVRVLLYGIPVVLTALVIWFAVARPVKVLPRGEAFPSFALTDQRGQPLSDGDLRGRMVLVSFAHTRCGAECAGLNAQLQAVRDELIRQGVFGSELLYLTISLDAAHDTPADLSIYAGQLGADPQSWRFVTGDAAQIKAIVGGALRIYYTQPDAAGRMRYEPQVVLLDGAGLLRAKYTRDSFTLARVERDLGLLREEAGSSGAMRSVYEASHLFLCYPE